MSLKVRLLHECFSTVGAHKLFLSLVIPKMVLERVIYGHRIKYGLSRRSPDKPSGI